MITPWGRADHKEVLAVGITVYSTPSHGGVKVNKEQNRLIPAQFRNENGWYEEDCEYLKVMLYYPHLFRVGQENAMTQDEIKQGIKTWFPSQVEAFLQAGGVW